MPDSFVLVLTTLPTAGDVADRIARTLVDERLAACVNLLPPMKSVYRWKGSLEEDDERQVVIKTTRARTDDMWNRLRELHPYEVPEFLVLEIADGSKTYLDWLRDSTTTDSGAERP